MFLTVVAIVADRDSTDRPTDSGRSNRVSEDLQFQVGRHATGLNSKTVIHDQRRVVGEALLFVDTFMTCRNREISSRQLRALFSYLRRLIN